MYVNSMMELNSYQLRKTVNADNERTRKGFSYRAMSVQVMWSLNSTGTK